MVLLTGLAGAAALERMVHASGDLGEPLDADRLAALAPEFRHPHGADVRAWWFPREGRIDFERLLSGLARGARAAGAEIRTHARVDALLTEDAGGPVVGVRLDSGETLRGARVVLAAGAWAGALGAAVGSRVALEPTRRHLMIAHLPAAARADAPILWDLDAGFYARPERGGWLVCLCDESAVPDPDALAADEGVLARLREITSRFLGAAPRSDESWSGLRTMTADDEFAIGPDPDVNGLFWVAGLGGAGMGAGWAAGDLAARLLGGEMPALAASTAPRRLVPMPQV
jgi:glycine/D-amino acid oxidase-like deaminating enzyme